MRISDWSSDVCSSDLPVDAARLTSTVDQQAPLQAWAAREQMAQAALEQARAAKRPDWSVSASYGKRAPGLRSEEHTSKLQSLMRTSYAVFCLKKKKKKHETTNTNHSA